MSTFLNKKETSPPNILRGFHHRLCWREIFSNLILSPKSPNPNIASIARGAAFSTIYFWVPKTLNPNFTILVPFPIFAPEFKKHRSKNFHFEGHFSKIWSWGQKEKNLVPRGVRGLLFFRGTSVQPVTELVINNSRELFLQFGPSNLVSEMLWLWNPWLATCTDVKNRLLLNLRIREILI